MEQAAELVRNLLSKMGIVAEVVAAEREDHIDVEVRGDETALVIGKKGATLEALQYLTNKMLRINEDPARKPVYIDAEGYRQRRADTLIELAHRLADKARETRRPVAVDPMSPADRRVMHVALANTPGLTTRSEGEGLSRRLVIVPDPNFDFSSTAAGNK